MVDRNPLIDDDAAFCAGDGKDFLRAVHRLKYSAEIMGRHGPECGQREFVQENERRVLDMYDRAVWFADPTDAEVEAAALAFIDTASRQTTQLIGMSLPAMRAALVAAARVRKEARNDR